MKKIICTLSIVFGFYSALVAQSALTVPYDSIKNPKRFSDKLVKNESFDKLVFQHLNFLIVGESTPSQGISTELKDNNTSLTVKGLLFENKKFITTIDGTFAVDDGVYFFDEKGGSKSSKFTMNFFVPFWGSRKFDKITSSNQTNRALVRNMVLEREIKKNAEQKLNELFAIILRTGLPALSPEELKMPELDIIDTRLRNPRLVASDKELTDQRKKYNAVTINKELLKKYALELPYNSDASYIETFTILHKKDKTKSQKEKDTVVYEYEINDIIKLDGIKPDEFVNINLLKLVDLYESAIKESKPKAIKDSIHSNEIAYTKLLWNSKKIHYVNISPFYERESKTIFTNPTNPTNFNDLFEDIRGDLFGLTLGYNYNRQYKSGNFLYLRFQSTLSRISNFSSFSEKRTFQLNDEEITVGSQTDLVKNIKGKEAFLDLEDQDYSFGFGKSFMGELYWSFYKGLGLFTNVGYNKIEFSNDKNAKNKETYPFRIGALFNLKAKDKTKNIITLQVFADRGDLSINPTPVDETKAGDWRFGFKLGLPINLKKQL